MEGRHIKHFYPIILTYLPKEFYCKSRLKKMKSILSLTVLLLLLRFQNGLAQAGALDSTFGYNGYTLTQVWQYVFANTGELQDDGKIVAAGWADTPGPLNTSWIISRYNAAGNLDPGFASGGISFGNTNYSGTGLIAISIAIQPDGKILCLGYINLLSAVTRSNSDGSLDSTFNYNGMITIEEYVLDIAVQQDGKL
jgi:uncharacterized delta-60 repeat protein